MPLAPCGPSDPGTVKAVSADGEVMMGLQPGAAYFRKAGVERQIINAGIEMLVFVEVELKDRPG